MLFDMLGMDVPSLNAVVGYNHPIKEIEILGYFTVLMMKW